MRKIKEILVAAVIACVAVLGIIPACESDQAVPVGAMGDSVTLEDAGSDAVALDYRRIYPPAWIEWTIHPAGGHERHLVSTGLCIMITETRITLARTQWMDTGTAFDTTSIAFSEIDGAWWLDEGEQFFPEKSAAEVAVKGQRQRYYGGND